MTPPTGPDASPPRLSAFAVEAHGAGATPVDPDEAADLIPTGIETVDQLNAFEQTNILSATEWVLRNRRRRTPAQVLSRGGEASGRVGGVMPRRRSHRVDGGSDWQCHPRGRAATRRGAGE